VQVVLISLRGMTRRDVMRLLNPYWFGGTRKPLPVTIELSDPIQLSEFRGPGMSSTRISLRVRDRFIKEFGSL